ncbi:hypothetical protein BLNAU_5269 [Blattamonas nauphoetae]|uniref:Protein kinase domain-containing protein n=1 Tax=Blattamonas nauphoetae TaxID=2049346 RepID=A0ABQ9Y7V2_9EUKA|nr:hypothetical protein BLNAU_5269 [Blattamonas nauphoetae]
MQFWAPEFFKTPVRTGTEIGSAAGDMWAFGLLLLEMLTSRSWIVGGSSVEIEKSVLGFDIGRICEKEGIVGDLQILLSLLLSKNPSKRISSTELVRMNHLQSLLGHETPLSRFFAEQYEMTYQQLDSTHKELYKTKQRLATSRQELETSKQRLETMYQQLQHVQQTSNKEHEELLKEQNEHKKTQRLLRQQEQTHLAIKTQMQSLERELLTVKEENRRLKEVDSNAHQAHGPYIDFILDTSDSW